MSVEERNRDGVRRWERKSREEEGGRLREEAVMLGGGGCGREGGDVEDHGMCYVRRPPVG